MTNRPIFSEIDDRGHALLVQFGTEELATQECATECSCAGARLPWLTCLERSFRAVNLTTTAAFVATVFLRSGDVTCTGCCSVAHPRNRSFSNTSHLSHTFSGTGHRIDVIDSVYRDSLLTGSVPLQVVVGKILMEPSSQPMSMRPPSGENATTVTSDRWGKFRSSCPV